MTLQNFHYVLSGREGAPWLVFLHGLLGSHRNWLKITPSFENDFHILNLDQRGHGESFKPSSGYAPTDFAADFKLIFDELRIQKAVLVGHSMGGRNALCFTDLYPECVSKLIMEDIGPERTYENGQALVDMLRRVPVPFKDKISAKQFMLNDFGDVKLGNFLYTHLRESVSSGSRGLAGSTDSRGAQDPTDSTDPASSKAITWDFSMSMVEEIISKGRSHDLWPELKGLMCPTLSIRGERSREYTLAEFEKVLAINPVIQGVQIPGTAHWVHFDKPLEFINVVRKFLD